MKSQIFFGLLGLGGLSAARRTQLNDPLVNRLHGHQLANMHLERRETAHQSHFETRDDAPAEPRFLSDMTKKFVVDGNGLPEVDFDVGESYAGQLPITDKEDEMNKLFFWFFPTPTKEFMDKKEIVIWLNGGPGCSSLLGFLAENGPISWAPGMPKPKPNPFSWHLLTNVVWVEQPVGAGFSTGNVTLTNEDELAEQFLGFWKNFMKTFAMQGWKVYITGESYGGIYEPFIANHMISADDKDYYDMSGMLIYDGIMFDNEVQGNIPSYEYVKHHRDLLPYADPAREKMKHTADKCGFTDFIEKYWQYPPSGPMPHLTPGLKMFPNGSRQYEDQDCASFFYDVWMESLKVNPCFNIYNIMDRCPERDDVLSGDDRYFDRTDVKKAINAPVDRVWKQCRTVFVEPGDQSGPTGPKVLPRVINKTKNVILAHGSFDYILTADGMLMGLQNMTWGCSLGLQKRPSAPFYVPYYGYNPVENYFDDPLYAKELPAGWGVLGTTHEERGLTVVLTQLAGHEGPEYLPAAAWRILEKLLGRVDNLSEKSSFSYPPIANFTQPAGELGNGTFVIPCYGPNC